MKTWTLPPDDRHDDPTLIHLSTETTEPTCVLDIYNADGLITTARARRLALLLNAAADYADTCRIAHEEDAA